MNETHVENCRRIFGEYYPEFARKTRTIPVKNIRTRWSTYQEQKEVALYSGNIGDLTVGEEDTFNADLCSIHTHQTLFPHIGRRQDHWKSLEIREFLYLLLKELKSHNRFELLGIDALRHVLLKPGTVNRISSDTICLLAGSTFVGRKGYLNVPAVSGRAIVPSPALHNPMRPEYSFLISVS